MTLGTRRGRKGRGMIKRFLGNDDGATAIEYGILVGLIGLALAATLTAISGEQNETFSELESGLKSRTVQPPAD